MNTARPGVRGLARIFCSITALLAGATVVAAQTPGPAVRDSYYRAGERVEVPGPINGDLIAAGREVIVGYDVSGDILATGRTVTLRAPAHDDVRVAAGEVRLDAPVGGDITAAGRTIVVGPAAHVEGRTWLTGGTINISGTLDRPVRIAAGKVTIAGEVLEPIHVAAGSLEILPGARVHGRLTYEGPSPAVVHEGATVALPITYRQTEARAANGSTSLGTTLLFILHLFVAGLVVYRLMPRFAREPEEVLRREPLRSFGLGFALLITVPIAALLLVITLIGLPLGIALGAGYAVALFLGLLTTAFFVGAMEARWFAAPVTLSRRQQAKYLLAGVLTLAILRAIPGVGPLVVFVSIVFGLGALGLWTYRSYHGQMAATPA